MLNLFLLFDSITNGFSLQYLHIFYILAIIFGVLTIVNRNPVVSVLFLIGLFVNVAGILIFIGYHFLGLAYILVYVGAVSILFLFILMLINIRVSELFTDTDNDLSLAILTIIYFYFIIGQVLPVNDFSLFIYKLKIEYYSIEMSLSFSLTDMLRHLYDYLLNDSYYLFYVPIIEYSNEFEVINYASSKDWDNSLIEPTHIASIGNIMYTSYSIWLIVTSIILLLGMVGAIMITIKQK